MALGKPGRPRKKELVSKVKFAEMCGMRPDTLYQYTGGDNPRVVTYGRAGQIDIRDKTNAEFLQLRKAKANEQAILDTANADQRIKLADLLKAEADAQLKSAKARILIKDLIDRRIVESTLDLIAKSIRELILPIGVRISPEIASICETTDREKILEIQKKVDDEIGRALEDIKKVIEDGIECNDFFVTFDEGNLEDLGIDGDE